MAIEAEALRALSKKATQGTWHHCQPFKSVPAVNTVHGRVPAQRVDYVSTWPALGTPPGHRVIIPMEGRECQVSSDDMAFIAALVSAYRDGSLIRRSALAEDTARASEIKPAILNILKALTLEADAVRNVDDLQHACLAAKFYAHEALNALPLDKEAAR